MAVLGVWMWPQSVRLYGAETVVSYCVRSRITDIFFLTKGLAGTTSYRSTLAPHACERDLLQELLTSAHRQGIRVHAWLTSASDEHYKLLHPESGRFHYTRGRDKALISLADKGYLAYMENVVRELCRNYEIDGLHLDYIRYNHLLYGWADEDLARYAQEGADSARLCRLMDQAFCGEGSSDENILFDAYRSGDQSVLALARARRKDVVRFARSLTTLARAERSSLTLSAALMPEGAYDDLAFSDLHYGQNYEDAAALYDYALPMAYSKAYGKDDQWVKKVAEGAIRRGLKTIMGLHAYEGGTGPSLQADAAALSVTPVEGICLFREGATALAYAAEKELRIYNPLEKPIIQVTANEGSDVLTLDASILPGEEKYLLLPFKAQSLRVFTESGEACVYLSGSAPL